MTKKENNERNIAGATEGVRRTTGVAPARPSQGRTGRPMKYDVLIEMLEDQTIYCPGTIIKLAEEKGYFPSSLDQDELTRAKLRARHSLRSFSLRHGLYESGVDGWVKIPGQTPLRGWYGHRWKAALKMRKKQ